MAHLLESLDKGKDIGHYGRLVFAMIGRHFLEEDELIKKLAKSTGFDEERARALLKQVEARGYNPPKRERILEWDGQQDFDICPNPEDPSHCNVYRNLEFPQEVYQRIAEFYERQGSGTNSGGAKR